MYVVRKLLGEFYEFIGECDISSHALRSGDTIKRFEPTKFDPFASSEDPQLTKVGTYPVIRIKDPDFIASALVIEARPDGDPLEWLPGYRPY